nr:rhodanese-like domain-containing protein [uncultured Dyadobacter sp.]
MMKLQKLFFIISICCITQTCFSQSTPKRQTNGAAYKKSLVSYADFKELVAEAEKHRAGRLIGFDDFLKAAKNKDVIILDARSAFRFKRKHLKGAVNLNFSDFTQENLRKIAPDKKTRILIYCNNNFEGDQVNFASKVAVPESRVESQILSNRKPRMLALNVPTYITLFGYGYTNVFELDELVNVNDKRVVFEGTEVK